MRKSTPPTLQTRTEENHCIKCLQGRTAVLSKNTRCAWNNCFYCYCIMGVAVTINQKP